MNISYTPITASLLAIGLFMAGCAQKNAIKSDDITEAPDHLPITATAPTKKAAKPTRPQQKKIRTAEKSQPAKRQSQNDKRSELSAAVKKPATAYPSIDLGKPFQVKYGQVLSLPDTNFRIKISHVRDNRCPLEMQCPHKGQATVILIIYHLDQRIDSIHIAGINTPVQLSTNQKPVGKSASYKVKLLELRPYPTIQFVEPQHYVAELVVTRN